MEKKRNDKMINHAEVHDLERGDTEIESLLSEKLKEDAAGIKIPEGICPEEIHLSKKEKLKKDHFLVNRRERFALLAAGLTILLLVGNRVKTNWNMPDSNSNLNENSESLVSDSDVTTESLSPENVASSYDEIYKVLSTKANRSMWTETTDDIASTSVMNDSKTDTDSTNFESEANKLLEDKEFSDTNVQVSGVDEGDILKNDGDYLYYLKDGNSIDIIKIDASKMEQVSELTVSGNITEFYVQGDRLVTVEMVEESEEKNTAQESMKSIWCYKEQSKVRIYDISNRRQPKKLKEFSQDGAIVSSRISDGYLYLFTREMLYNKMNQDSLDTYVPKVDGEYILPCDIVIPDVENISSYLVLSAINIEEADKMNSTKGILSGAYQFYVSGSSIYTVENNYSYRGMIEDVLTDDIIDSGIKELKDDSTVEDNQSTKSSSTITRYEYEKGSITYKADTTIDGNVNNQFSLDEYNGYLRVVSTVIVYDDNTTYNNLYIFDKGLKQVGQIEKLAKEELIYSARFMGNTGYFVTFKQMDPLFSVDLSNPSSPKILGELKITGFSSYLHFYSDSLLLGIGEEVDPKTSERLGVKLSMFDISDPSDVKEISKTVISEIDYGEFQYNHKAIMIDTKKNLFGFSGESYKENQDTVDRVQNFYLYSYDEKNGFVQEMMLDATIDTEEYYSVRGTYVGDTLYLAYITPYEVMQDKDEQRNQLEAYSISRKEKIGELTIR